MTARDSGETLMVTPKELVSDHLKGLKRNSSPLGASFMGRRRDIRLSQHIYPRSRLVSRPKNKAADKVLSNAFDIVQFFDPVVMEANDPYVLVEDVEVLKRRPLPVTDKGPLAMVTSPSATHEIVSVREKVSRPDDASVNVLQKKGNGNAGDALQLHFVVSPKLADGNDLFYAISECMLRSGDRRESCRYLHIILRKLLCAFYADPGMVLRNVRNVDKKQLRKAVGTGTSICMPQIRASNMDILILANFIKKNIMVFTCVTNPSSKLAYVYSVFRGAETLKSTNTFYLLCADAEYTSLVPKLPKLAPIVYASEFVPESVLSKEVTERPPPSAVDEAVSSVVRRENVELIPLKPARPPISTFRQPSERTVAARPASSHVPLMRVPAAFTSNNDAVVGEILAKEDIKRLCRTCFPKPLVVMFYMPGCGLCLRDTPTFNEFVTKYSGMVAFAVGVGIKSKLGGVGLEPTELGKHAGVVSVPTFRIYSHRSDNVIQLDDIGSLERYLVEKYQ